MEYYLSLVEYLDYFNKDDIDPFDYAMYLSDIDSYLAKLSKDDTTHAYMKKISNQRKKFEY